MYKINLTINKNNEANIKVFELNLKMNLKKNRDHLENPKPRFTITQDKSNYFLPPFPPL